MAEGDESGAARVLSERVQMAPEAKARRVLPQFFPRAAQALPTLTQENASRLVDSRDIESFMKAIDKQVAHAPKRKGAGWGGSVAELLALGNNMHRRVGAHPAVPPPARARHEHRDRNVPCVRECTHLGGRPGRDQRCATNRVGRVSAGT